MPLLKPALGFDVLYNTDTPISDLTVWRSTFALNVQNYFNAASNVAVSLPGVPPDGFLYTFTNLTPGPSTPTWTANINTLYADTTTEDETTWGNTLGGYINDLFTSFLYVGTKQMISTPFTVSPWTGTVASIDGGTSLKATLTALYTSGLDDINAWKTQMETAIDTFAKTCYCQFPSFLMT